MDVRQCGSTANLGMHSNNGLTDDLNGLNLLLIDYLRALTDVCKLGILLAGKLDRQLQTKRCTSEHLGLEQESVLMEGGGAAHAKLDRKQMTHIGSFYSNIMSQMGALWQQTIFENGDEDLISAASGCQLTEKQYLTMIDSGSPLLGSRDTQNSGCIHSKRQLSRKTSPCIVITTAAEDSPSSHSQTAVTTTGMSGPTSAAKQVSSSNQLTTTESHVPTDDDMNAIINFLSSTRLPETRLKPDLSSATSQSSVTAAVSKLPLGAQRSSPLPGAAARFLEKEGITPTGHSLGRHNSDWQLYKPTSHTQPTTALAPPGSGSRESFGFATGLCVPTAPTQSYSGSDLSQHSASPFTASHLQLPFTKWSSKLPTKDAVWSHDSAASSGDESQSNTEQLFNSSQTLDLTHLVTQTRRSSHDSNASSHTFETGTSSTTKQKTQTQSSSHSMQGRCNVNSGVMQPNWTTGPTPSCSTSSWSVAPANNNTAASTITGGPVVSGQLGLAVVNRSDSIWTPLAGSSVTDNSSYLSISPPACGTSPPHSVPVGTHMPILSSYQNSLHTQQQYM